MKHDNGGKVAVVALSVAVAAIAAMGSLRAEAAPPAGLVQIPDCEDCNFIIITQDVLRAKNTSAYGYARDTTPNLTKFAGIGLKFERGYSPATWTIPSVGSLLNQASVLDNQLNYMWDPTFQSWRAISERTTPVARVAKEHGLESYAIIETDVFRPEVNVGREFTRWDVFGHHSQPVEPVRERLKDLKARNQRFFMYVHFRGAHVALKPPEQYHGLFRETPLAYEGVGYHRRFPVTDTEYGARFVDAYDQTVRWYDDAVGKIVAGVAEAGLAGKTFILFTADHGTGLGDVKEAPYGYGPVAYEEVVGVPMVLMGPGVTRGARVPDPVSQLDVAYTVLDAIGLDKKPEYNWRGQDLRTTRPKSVVSWAADRLEVRDATHKYVWFYATDQEKAYALTDEETPIAVDSVPALKELRATAKAVHAAAKQLNEGTGQADIEMSEQDLEILRALGYVE